MFACICAAVTETEVRQCVAGGARTVEEIGDDCGAGTGCGSCVQNLDVLLLATRAPAELEGFAATA